MEELDRGLLVELNIKNLLVKMVQSKELSGLTP